MESPIPSLFDSLPDELIDHLVHLLDSESSSSNLDVHPNLKTLSLLSRTSSIFHSKCLPILLEAIRLPFTHTPIGSPSPLLISARDSVAIKLARTLRHNDKLARLVRELEITSRWYPDDGMERCREAYQDILNASTEACAIAFFVGRGEYNGVLGSIKSSYSNLVALSIGIENLERDLKNPFLQPQLDPRLVQQSDLSNPDQSTPKIQLMTSYNCPNLIHLHLQLPSYIKLDEKTSFILSALPPSIQHLEISLLQNPSDFCGDFEGESDLSVDFGPGRKAFQIVASLFKTRFVRKSSHAQEEDEHAVDSQSNISGNKIETKLKTLTLRFSEGNLSTSSNRRSNQQLESREDLAVYLPSQIYNPSLMDQDPFIKTNGKDSEVKVKYKQPEQLLRLLLPEHLTWLPPVSIAADYEGLLLWRAALNDGFRKGLIREKKLEVLNRNKGWSRRSMDESESSTAGNELSLI